MSQRQPLYGKAQAKCLQIRETMRDDGKKYSLLLEHLGSCRRLVDIGAGWGQFLAWRRSGRRSCGRWMNVQTASPISTRPVPRQEPSSAGRISLTCRAVISTPR